MSNRACRSARSLGVQRSRFDEAEGGSCGPEGGWSHLVGCWQGACLGTEAKISPDWRDAG